LADSNPAKSWYIDPFILDPDTLRDTEGPPGVSLLLELGKRCPTLEEVNIGPLQIRQSLLHHLRVEVVEPLLGFLQLREFGGHLSQRFAVAVLRVVRLTEPSQKAHALAV